MRSKVEAVVSRMNAENHKAYIVAAVYRPPCYTSDQIKEDIEALNIIMNELSDTKKPYFILGDFNMGRDNAYFQLKYLCKRYNAKQLITKPTRGKAILDLLITNSPKLCKNTTVIDSYISDHNAILTTLNLTRTKHEKVAVKYRAFNRIVPKDIHNDLDTYKNTLLTQADINLDDMYNDITNMILTVFNKHAPIRTKTFNQYPNSVKPSKATKHKIYMRNVARNVSISSPSDNTKKTFQHLNKQVKESIKQDMKFKTQQDISAKGIWPVLNKLTRKRSEVVNKFCANNINDHFVEISNAPTKQSCDTSNIKNPKSVLYLENCSGWT
ncbi:unnamed protein product [Orchesella dallaii]|uniref:Endonuclease/exonuclease/phosphatase domain-containing protein n=1 Tax=Orchesella dallaii TaxID=48710 RepID=A0ABP1QGQ2_9HEXA